MLLWATPIYKTMVVVATKQPLTSTKGLRVAWLRKELRAAAMFEVTWKVHRRHIGKVGQFQLVVPNAATNFLTLV
jgi:hypothetical protein